MENFYLCKVKYDSIYSTLIISTDKIFPNQFNKNHLEQLTDLIDMAFDKVLSYRTAWKTSLERNELSFVYFKRVTKEEIVLLDKEWFDEDDEYWY